MAEKRMPAKKKKMTRTEQAERFKQTARELEADEAGESFERAFSRIAPVKRRPEKADKSKR